MGENDGRIWSSQTYRPSFTPTNLSQLEKAWTIELDGPPLMYKEHLLPTDHLPYKLLGTYIASNITGNVLFILKQLPQHV